MSRVAVSRRPVVLTHESLAVAAERAKAKLEEAHERLRSCQHEVESAARDPNLTNDNAANAVHVALNLFAADRRFRRAASRAMRLEHALLVAA